MEKGKKYFFLISLLTLTIVTIVAGSILFTRTYGQELCGGGLPCAPGEICVGGVCLPDNGGTCFTGDTPIRMADDSQKPIEEVEEGDLIKSFDEETGEIVDSEVTKVFKHGAGEIEGYWILTTESGREIKVTPEHPILVLDENGNRVWRTAEEIEEGDYAFVFDEEGNLITKESNVDDTTPSDEEVGSNEEETTTDSICTDLSCLSEGPKNILDTQTIEEDGVRYTILTFDTGEKIKLPADTRLPIKDGKVILDPHTPEEAQAIIDQEQSQSESQSSTPSPAYRQASLLQILFPPLWLFSQIFKN